MKWSEIGAQLVKTYGKLYMRSDKFKWTIYTHRKTTPEQF